MLSRKFFVEVDSQPGCIRHRDIAVCNLQGASDQVGMEVVGTICLVDREEGGREAIEAQGIGFERVYTLAELLG